MNKIYLISWFVLITFLSCDDSITNPPEPDYGVTGKIIDESGNPLNNVKVYYLFNFTYIPNQSNSDKLLNDTEVDSFDYELFQNFPNPVYKSSFIRYSLNSDADIELTLTELYSGLVKYSVSKPSYYGIYQHYFNNIVDSLQLENGFYKVEFKAFKNGVLKYKSEKKLVVISDLGRPCSISDKNGKYYFDYDKSSIGDTLTYTFDEEYSYTSVIDKSVNLLLQKEGFYNEIVNTSLYKGILINRDVVMRKVE